MLNVLYMGLWKKDVKWKEEKEKLQRNVGSLGKFLKNAFYLYFREIIINRTFQSLS